jgi:hypothetical protein|tara:strand:- start:8709 stop:8981 length:273 start_codon:yes stop_codon:yes gene_type:complete
MKNFINIVWENKEVSEVDEYLVDTVLECADEALTEDETNYETYDTIEGGTVLAVELHKPLNDDESTVIAERLANKLFDLGHNNFDIEISV